MPIDVGGAPVAVNTELNNITIKGHHPLGDAGKLLVDATVTNVQIGQWVIYDTTNDGWVGIDETTTVNATDSVGIVAQLRSAVADDGLKNSVDVDAEVFESALIYQTGGGFQLLASDTKIWDTGPGEAVTFDVTVHTSLAGRLEIKPRTGINGEEIWFSFR